MELIWGGGEGQLSKEFCVGTKNEMVENQALYEVSFQLLGTIVSWQTYTKCALKTTGMTLKWCLEVPRIESIQHSIQYASSFIMDGDAELIIFITPSSLNHLANFYPREIFPA